MHFKIAAEDKTNHRYSGVLAHPTSFPSPYGVGDIGKEAEVIPQVLQKRTISYESGSFSLSEL